jgi:fatty-acyl-CoA synthase
VSPSDALAAAILDFLSTQVSRWWLPEKVIFVEQIPLTATGKIDKKQLRKIYGV